MRLPLKLVDRLIAPFLGRPRTAPKGVLLVAAGGLGDTVLLLALIDRFLGLARPGERVTLLLRSDAAKMGFLAPPAIEILAIDFKRLARDAWYRFRSQADLRRRGYRVAVSLDYLRHPDLDEALIRAAQAPERAAMIARPWPKHQRALDANQAFFGRLFDSGPPRHDKALRWAAFADWLTGVARGAPVLRLPDERLPAPDPFEAPTVMIQPFSAVAAKQIAPASWRAILDSLPADHRVRILGAPSDLDRNPAYRALLDPVRVTFDSRPFQALLPNLRAARLVISVDTALMHLAALSGAPTLGLASAAFVGEIVPYDQAIMPTNLRVLYQVMPCAGCLGDCRYPLEGGMYRCLAALEPNAMITEIQAMLGGG
ncbi:MAG: lipopolysaccharide heptosyltransferase family protein [Rhodospirillales bacterium]|nr:lipopolysaccharide heptosyltransferase family protein [Rhodospirillales bacterium]